MEAVQRTVAGLSQRLADLEVARALGPPVDALPCHLQRAELCNHRRNLGGLRDIALGTEVLAPPPLVVAPRFNQHQRGTGDEYRGELSTQALADRGHGSSTEGAFGCADSDSDASDAEPPQVQSLDQEQEAVFSDASTDSGGGSRVRHPLLRAIAAGDETSALLLLSGIDPEEETLQPRSVDSPRGFAQRFSPALRLGSPLQLDACDRRGRTALHCAAARGMASLCRMLVEYQASTLSADQRDRRCRTPLHHAAAHGHARVCRCLLDDPRTEGLCAADSSGLTALHWAARGGHARACKVLLRHPRFAHANAVDTLGRTALHHAARNGHSEACVPFLRSQRFNGLWARDRECLTALHCAAFRGHVKACETLISHGSFQRWCREEREGARLLDHSAEVTRPLIAGALSRAFTCPACCDARVQSEPGNTSAEGLGSPSVQHDGTGWQSVSGKGPPTLAWQEKRHELGFYCGVLLNDADSRLDCRDLSSSLGCALLGMEQAVQDLASATLPERYARSQSPRAAGGVDAPVLEWLASQAGSDKRGRGEKSSGRKLAKSLEPAPEDGLSHGAEARESHGGGRHSGREAFEMQEPAPEDGLSHTGQDPVDSACPLEAAEADLQQRLAQDDARLAHELQRLEEQERREALEAERRRELLELKRKEERLRAVKEQEAKARKSAEVAEAEQKQQAELARKRRPIVNNVVAQLKTVLGAQRMLFGKKISDPSSFFDALDRDKNHTLEGWEIAAGLRRLDVPVSEEDLMAFIGTLDADASGLIERAELIRALEESLPGEPAEDLRTLRRETDKSRSRAKSQAEDQEVASGTSGGIADKQAVARSRSSFARRSSASNPFKASLPASKADARGGEAARRSLSYAGDSEGQRPSSKRVPWSERRSSARPLAALGAGGRDGLEEADLGGAYAQTPQRHEALGSRRSS